MKSLTNLNSSPVFAEAKEGPRYGHVNIAIRDHRNEEREPVAFYPHIARGVSV